jgi:molybdopterin-guanine dinucleotide biosynthesis protein
MIQLHVRGPQGSGKTTLARLLRSLLRLHGYIVEIHDTANDAHDAARGTEVLIIEELIHDDQHRRQGRAR